MFNVSQSDLDALEDHILLEDSFAVTSTNGNNGFGHDELDAEIAGVFGDEDRLPGDAMTFEGRILLTLVSLEDS